MKYGELELRNAFVEFGAFICEVLIRKEMMIRSDLAERLSSVARHSGANLANATGLEVETNTMLQQVADAIAKDPLAWTVIEGGANDDDHT